MTGRPVSHSQATRIAHAGLSLAVGVAFLSGIIMRPPLQNYPANVFFEVHLISVCTAATFALAFWAVVLTRKTGSAAGLLVPWFSPFRLKALWCDVQAHASGAAATQLSEASPVAAAFQGLGLLLVTAMALSGLLADLAEAGGFVGEQTVCIATHLSHVLDALVWLYILAHGLMALIHHYGLDKGLAEMWSLGRSTDTEGRER